MHDIWIDLHTAVFPAWHPLARHLSWQPDAIVRDALTIQIGGASAAVMNDERQLVYTAARWAEALDARRGLFGALDAAMILSARGEALDWDGVHALTRGTWAARALHLLLRFLDRTQLARIPGHVLDRAATEAPIGNAVMGVLQRLADACILRGRGDGPLARRTAAVWSALAGAAPATVVIPERVRRTFRPARSTFVRRMDEENPRPAGVCGCAAGLVSRGGRLEAGQASIGRLQPDRLSRGPASAGHARHEGPKDL